MILINNKDFSKIKIDDIEKFLDDYNDDESFFIELKNDKVSPKDLIKEICAFSNTFGGYVFLGVEDNKTVTGCIDWTEERINNSIRNLMDPTPIFDVRKITKNEIKVFVIKIEEGTMPPYITNKGIIYERISSSSFPIKDSFTVNRILDKRKDNIKKIENKIYIEPIRERINNLCGYLDFGFSVTFKDSSKATQKLLNADFKKISDILKEAEMKYSISKVGYSICIAIGNPKCGNEYIDQLVPAGLNHFMEILPDGSVRGRVVFIADTDGNPQNTISSGLISMMYNFFKKVYYAIFNNNYCLNFIEARKFEKLTVLKIFEPKIISNPKDEYYNKFEPFSIQHNNKYGSNTVVNSNRIPMNEFYVVDKKALQERKIKYNDENLINELFGTSYFLLGYIDKPKITDDD
ncbi:MAG: ATP-binding protein [Bacilli bacterium]|nr:ATP-binding protein [Bacilli bacterium]